jgi:nucleoid-associated protein YgaU
MALKKFVPFGPKKMVVVKKPTAKPKVIKKTTPPRQNNKAQPKVYSLIKGDNLWKLAKRFLGSGTRYPEIQKLNGIKDSQLRRLPIGLKVKIPPK